jgi:hypothetical protein
MTNLTIPDWSIVLGLLTFAIMLSGAAGALYLRIGKIEGKIDAKLNGSFTKVCNDVEGIKSHMPEIKSDVKVLRSDMNVVRTDIAEIKPKISKLEAQVYSSKLDK